MGKKILMLLETRFPPDERVEKEMLTLMENGYEVHICCAARANELPEENYKDIQIHRMKISPMLYKLGALVLILPIYLNRWTRFVEKILKQHQFVAMHIHDLPLAGVGFRLKKRYNLKIICDQHEYYSNWIVDTAHYNTFIGKIVKLLSHWKKYEKRALSLADLVITVEEPLRKQYIFEYQLAPEKIIILPNTPSKKVFTAKNEFKSEFSAYENRFSVLYFGGLDILRGIDNIITAIPEIAENIPDFKLVLAGKVYGGYDPLRTATKYKVEAYVDFLGWIDLKRIPSLISVCDMGIFIPPSNRTEINKTIATKNYQFLVMQKPMIVGNARYMKEFTEENGIGISIDENNPHQLAEAIINFRHDEEARNNMIENCRKIGSGYYWEITSRPLVSAYMRIIERQTGASI